MFQELFRGVSGEVSAAFLEPPKEEVFRGVSEGVSEAFLEPPKGYRGIFGATREVTVISGGLRGVSVASRDFYNT